MAWISFIIGACVAVVVAILAYTLLDLPLWVALLCYPLVGILVALAVLVNLFMRSTETVSNMSATDCGRFSKLTATFGHFDI